MKILEQALNKINSLNNSTKKFMLTLIAAMISTLGKRNFRNLSRYADIHEKTISRNMNKSFEFAAVNHELAKSWRRQGDIIIGCQDTTSMAKSGKLTEGMGYIWNNTNGKIEKGIEFDLLGIARVNDKKSALTISAEQVPASLIPKSKKPKKSKKKSKKASKKKPEKQPKNELTKIDLAVAHVAKVIQYFLNLDVKYMVADAFYAKYKYVNGIISLGLHVISKLRKDAVLREPFLGKNSGRGRPKKYENERITAETMSMLIPIVLTDENGDLVELRSKIAYSISMKQLIKVVFVKTIVSPTKFGSALLFATDTQADPEDVYHFYKTRFQIEFVFRDAKGSTGLADCQSLKASRLHFHVNASLMALNAMKIEDQNVQQKQGTVYAFSILNWTRKYLIEIILNRFISMLELDQNVIKSHPNFEKLLSIGAIDH